MNIVAENHAATLRQTWQPGIPVTPERDLLDAVAHDLRTAYDADDADMPAGLIAMASRLDIRILER